MTSARVLVFDSGVGGLSVAACIHQQLPAAKIVYVADNAGFPYGNQREAVVVERCQALIEAAMVEFPCDVIVVACNTASTVVLPHLRAATSTPVIGVVPAVKPAAALSVNRRIGILATPATIRRPYLMELIREFASDCSVERLGHPDLVHWIERRVAGTPVPEQALARALQPFRDAAVDTVVLGCTHYPLIGGLLRKHLPEVKFWVDSGDAIARRTAWLLDDQGGGAGGLTNGNSDGSTACPVEAALFSGSAPRGIGQFMTGLGLGVASIRSHWPVAAEGATTSVSA